MTKTPLIAWTWITLFRLILTLTVGWLLAERMLGRYIAIANVFNSVPWRR